MKLTVEKKDQAANTKCARNFTLAGLPLHRSAHTTRLQTMMGVVLRHVRECTGATVSSLQFSIMQVDDREYYSLFCRNCSCRLEEHDGTPLQLRGSIKGGDVK